MSGFSTPLLLDLDVVSLTMSLVNIASETGDERGLADSLENALTPLDHLTVERIGNTVVARTHERRAGERVLVAGHVDTVTGDPDSFAYVEMGKLFGAGACDAKGALAVMLRAALAPTTRDVTFVFYSGAEGDGRHGLAALADARPDLVDADVAVLLEPTAGGVSTSEPAFARLVELTSEQTAIAPPTCSGTDVIAARGTRTVAFGPGDPSLAHSPGEFVRTAELTECEYALRTWLRG